MKYYSEVLKKCYDSVEALEKAELEVKKKDEEKAKKDAEKSKRAKEVEEAFKTANAAYKKAEELLSDYLKDYKTFHTTYSSEDAPIGRGLRSALSLFDDFWNI